MDTNLTAKVRDHVRGHTVNPVEGSVAFAPRWPGDHAMAAVRPNNICIPTWFEKDQWRY